MLHLNHHKFCSDIPQVTQYLWFYHPGFVSAVQLNAEIKPKPHHSWLLKGEIFSCLLWLWLQSYRLVLQSLHTLPWLLQDAGRKCVG